MAIYKLRPWSEIVSLHPDVEAGNTAVATYAIDLGALAAGDKNIPAIYRESQSFFKVTYPTSGLKRLLDEVFDRLSGKEGDRVLQLRSPFGGGKSHTLAALYHAATNPKALASEKITIPDPGKVRVAVFDGEKFDAIKGKEVDGQVIRTMWGWLAYQLGGKDVFPLLREHDEKRVAPGGDVIAKMFQGGPTLLLLDEVLKYLERAAGEAIAGSTLGRQTQDFIANLSVEVARSKNAVLVYSLQASARESYGNVGLLDYLDHLTSRVDAKREPVTGDEILHVLHRRLLGKSPPSEAAAATASAYGEVITKMKVAHAEGDQSRKLAEEESLKLQRRMQNAYPFHPALIDLMKERWASIPDFQRTRGALRFLAVCLYALKKSGQAQGILGPGDIPLENADVRYAFFTEVGQREAFQAVLEADLIGPNARSRRIDERFTKENPALSGVKPASTLATAILMYSFGGLPREGDTPGDSLPPGITETELLAACVGPDLDWITAQACLKELRTHCLFVHYDGARYCFKTSPNVTKLIEDESEAVSVPEITNRVGEILDERLAGRMAQIWPNKSQDVPDEEPVFQIAYMPLELADLNQAEQEKKGRDILEDYGERPRRYRNAIGLAIPNKGQVEPLKRAVRYLLAIERVEKKKKQLGVTKEQAEQLKERHATEESALESALRHLYAAVWLPKSEGKGLEIERIEVGGKPLQAKGIHERLLELLTTSGQKKLFGTLEPQRIIELLRLGEGEPPKLGISAKEVGDAFFSFLGYPRLTDEEVIKKAIIKGVEKGLFGFLGHGTLTKDPAGNYQLKREQVTIGKNLTEDEIDLSAGFILLPKAIPQEKELTLTPPEGPAVSPPVPPEGGTQPSTGPMVSQGQRSVHLEFNANRTQLFQAWNAVANLAEKAGTVKVEVEAQSEKGFDPNWLRNAVFEPLEEADLIKEKKEN